MTTTKKEVKIPAGLLTVPEVAKLRGVQNATVYQWLKMGLAHQEDRLGRMFIRAVDAKRFKPRPQGWQVGVVRKVNAATIEQVKVLRLGGAKLSIIADRMKLSIGTISGIVKRLKASGEI